MGSAEGSQRQTRHLPQRIPLSSSHVNPRSSILHADFSESASQETQSAVGNGMEQCFIKYSNILSETHKFKESAYDNDKLAELNFIKL